MYGYKNIHMYAHVFVGTSQVHQSVPQEVVRKFGDVFGFRNFRLDSALVALQDLRPYHGPSFLVWHTVIPYTGLQTARRRSCLRNFGPMVGIVLVG